jgi:hypothetical protein
VVLPRRAVWVWLLLVSGISSCKGVAAERRRAFAMSDREKLLMALLCESERRSGAKVSVSDVIRMLERLGAEHRHARKRGALLTNA